MVASLRAGVPCDDQIGVAHHLGVDAPAAVIGRGVEPAAGWRARTVELVAGESSLPNPADVT